MTPEEEEREKLDVEFVNGWKPRNKKHNVNVDSSLSPEERRKKYKADWIRADRAANPEKHRALWREYRNSNKDYYKYWSLQKKYGLSREDFNSLVVDQKGECAICGEVLGETLDVDHNHITGKVRGLLCNNCNRGLGFFNEDFRLLRKASIYLAQHSADDYLYPE